VEVSASRVEVSASGVEASRAGGVGTGDWV